MSSLPSYIENHLAVGRTLFTAKRMNVSRLVKMTGFC